MTLRIRSVDRGEGFHEIALEGRLDSNTYLEFEKLLDTLFNAKLKGIAFDLGGLSYMSSMGLRLFLRSAGYLKTVNGQLVFRKMQPQIKKVFDIANAIPSFAIFESVEEADRYLERMQQKALEGGDDK
ncbi:MAG: STAS domain-containing protein [Candidatus Riflebacteria bacterium]|nr:STAS domain-containing protein [Candidatus Riflebacteria bacterium]